MGAARLPAQTRKSSHRDQHIGITELVGKASSSGIRAAGFSYFEGLEEGRIEAYDCCESGRRREGQTAEKVRLNLSYVAEALSPVRILPFESSENRQIYCFIDRQKHLSSSGIERVTFGFV